MGIAGRYQNCAAKQW